MPRAEPTEAEFKVQIWISAIFIAAGFAVLLLGLGQESSAKMAAGWLGAVLGFWLR
jgi:hypothetical protein